MPKQTRKGESLYGGSFQQSLNEWVGFGRCLVAGWLAARLSGWERRGEACQPRRNPGRKELAWSENTFYSSWAGTQSYQALGAGEKGLL